jgi:outer membrane biosynthesis protein TonB
LPAARIDDPDPVPGIVTARRIVLVAVLGAALFAGSYGVGRAREAEPAPKPQPRTAKSRTSVPTIGNLGKAAGLPRMARRPRRKAAPTPVVRAAEPEPKPEARPEPVQPVQPAPEPAPVRRPAPVPSPTPSPSPGGGFDDSG